MRDSEQIYHAAKKYVAEFENYKKMDEWIQTHSNEEAIPLESRIHQIIDNTSKALNSLIDVCNMGA